MLLWLIARAEVPLDRFIVALFSPGATIHMPTSEFGLPMRSYHGKRQAFEGLSTP